MNGPTAIAVGLALGLRHATDADHVVALATLLRGRAGLRGALLIGGVWGVGHSVVLLAAGVVVVLLGVRLPASFDRLGEWAVAAMLVGLGGHHLLRKDAERAHGEPHEHGRRGHSVSSLRPLLIGMVHGLAGSAGIALLALTTLSAPRVAMLYLLLFGLGTVAGMMALTGLLSIPLRHAGRSPRLESRLVRIASAASLGLGLLLAVECSLSS